MLASPALISLMGLPTIFRLQFGKQTYGTGLGTHSASLPRSAGGSTTGLEAGCGLAGTRCRRLQWGRLGGRGVTIPSLVRGRGGRQAGLGSFQKERRRLHLSHAWRLFISTAGWKHAGAPGTPISIARFQAQQQPGTFLN